MITNDNDVKSSYDIMNDSEIIDELNTDLSIDSKLTLEEKEIIKKNKKRKKNKPKSITSSLNGNIDDYQFTKEEMEQAKALYADLDSFVSKSTDMVVGDGEIDVLPTGIDLLDAVLGGGFGVGTLTLLVGSPGSFKSTLVGQLIGRSQKKFKGRLMSSYLDSESSMTTQRLSQLGVNLPRIKPYPEITVEQVFKTIEAQSAFKDLKDLNDVPSIISWDSVANTITMKERSATGDDIHSCIGLKARILSMLLPKYIMKMRQYKISLIAINQLRDNLALSKFAPSPDLKYLGKNKTMNGGMALKHNAFHMLLLKVSSDLKYDKYNFNGVIIEAKCVKNKLFTPNIPVKLIVDFKRGLSNFWTNYYYLVTTKRINTGMWNSLFELPETKFRTKNAENLYKEDDKFRTEFKRIIKEAIQTDIIDVYDVKD